MLFCEFSQHFLLNYGCCMGSSVVSVLDLPENKLKNPQAPQALQLLGVPNDERGLKWF